MRRPTHPLRFVTAASLFDGHDASINLFRRLLQSSGVEVIHLGHNRSVEEIVQTAIQEDVQGIALSSYQGGHMHFFHYLLSLLAERNASHIQVFAGGGGVIVEEERRELERQGLSKVFSPQDGRKLGLQGMVDWMIEHTDHPTVTELTWEWEALRKGNQQAIARMISYSESHLLDISRVSTMKPEKKVPVIGITGTGGAGKSSLTDEIVRRFLRDFPEKQIAILSIDPTKQKTGGALLGDRIRMNSIHHPHVYMRSLATRKAHSELCDALEGAIAIVKAAGYDLVIVETSGIGQGDAEIVKVADCALYVMTAEYGSPSQLEKIEMLDYADFVVINKFDRRGALDALRDVAKQYQRNHLRFSESWEVMPVYGTMANRFGDLKTEQFYQTLCAWLHDGMWGNWQTDSAPHLQQIREVPAIILPERVHYLREISSTVRKYHQYSLEQTEAVRVQSQLLQLKSWIKDKGDTVPDEWQSWETEATAQLSAENQALLAEWKERSRAYQQDKITFQVRERQIEVPLTSKTLSGTTIPKVALPTIQDQGDLLQWLHKENLPGYFPFTSGVYPFKRSDEDPKRQFAGEGSPERTNKRFHYLSKNDAAKRLSTAFDSVTLYGEDPNERPDIYGKIGESGVSVCTLDNMKQLFNGFNLCAPSTSVSMTINGPAPIILAMFFNAAIEQQLELFRDKKGREPNVAEHIEIQARTLREVRGTVQADILKEDQGQNTCIFSTEFALKLMGDMQQYFIEQQIRNYYSVSISGYHIAEAGANPISQLAFTLANAFTYVEYYLSRGMNIDQFAPNLSFFFSNGLDAEYAVIGRVARRIWSIVMKQLYKGNERSQKLKYHIQTSGRSLHAQEMSFNDIRTTLQALLAIVDQCNSLHTNAYDEAITTPTEDSVRRAMAIQLIITKELGIAKNENIYQGSYFIEQLTDWVEEAVLQEFERISDRGGVLGAMETQYQRSKIQDESHHYEAQKHSGELPIIGVNTFEKPGEEEPPSTELTRASDAEKKGQIKHVRQFQKKHQHEAKKALARLQQVVIKGENIFAELMETTKVASLGQITQTLYEVGGQYRRNM